MCASGPSRRGAAAGLLVAVAALLALPLQAHAQTISIGAETDGTGDAEGVEGDTIELTVKLSAVSTGAVTAKWRYVEVRQRARRERSPPRPRPGRIPPVHLVSPTGTSGRRSTREPASARAGICPVVWINRNFRSVRGSVNGNRYNPPPKHAR